MGSDAVRMNDQREQQRKDTNQKCAPILHLKSLITVGRVWKMN